MKHPSTRVLYSYWNERRGNRPAPDRTDIDPAASRHALGDTFMLAADFVDRLRFRLAGTCVCARLVLPNGTNVACRVIDLSASGAAVAIAPDLRPAVGAAVTIGKTPGRVVRHIEEGFAIEFTRLQHPDFIEDNVTGD